MLRTPAKESAAKAMQAAIDGGFNIVEFTLTTPGCLDLVADFRKKVIMMCKDRAEISQTLGSMTSCIVVCQRHNFQLIFRFFIATGSTTARS